MKAVIMAAGRTCVILPATKIPGFPAGSKPKCLFHVGGEVILERQIRVLKKVGINEIIIVGGYKIELIKQFIEAKKLGLKVAYNPTAASDHWVNRGWAAGLDTVKVGLQGLDDDVLLICGDALLTEKGVRSIIEHPKPCISVFSHHGYQMYKIPRDLLPKLRKLNAVGAMHALHDFCMGNNGIKIEIKGPDIIYDVDHYNQTDEGK